MTLSDDILMLYVDGELAADERPAVESAIAQDPSLAARVAALHAQRERLRQAYASVLDEAVPERLISVLGATEPKHAGSMVSLDARRAAGVVRQRVKSWSWPEWSAIAASLVVGLLVMQTVAVRSGGPAVQSGSSGLVAGRALAVALTTQLASNQPRGATFQVGLTFENSSGQLCRTFSARTSHGWSGLACFVDGEWRMGMMLADPADRSEPTGASALRTAGSAMPEALLRAVTSQIRGEPLDADAERAARDRGWHR